MKRGFTLIELLAVIVILAIIAFIVVPIVLNIINDARASSNLRSAELYLDAVEYMIANSILNYGVLKDGVYPVTEDGDICKTSLPCTLGNKLKVEVNGKKPASGEITIKGGTVIEAEIILGDKKIIKNEDNEMVYEGELCTRMKGKENIVGTKYVCDFGDGKRTFYILELGANPVADTKLKKDEVALILEGNYDMTTQAWCASGSSNTCNADGLTPKLNDIRSSWTKLNSEQVVLPSFNQVILADNQNISDFESTGYINLKSEWLFNWPDYPGYGDADLDGYWTSTPYNTNNAIAVFYWGLAPHMPVSTSNSYGVRPVVNLRL